MIKIKKILLSIAMTMMIVTSSFSNATEESDSMETEVTNIVSQIVSKEINLNKEQGGDYFNIWLSELFGDFIFEPWGYDAQSGDASATVLAKTVGFTNILAMILGVVIVYYVLLGGALNTAHSGEALGKQWSSIWIPIRTGLGFSLIMPITSVGGGVFSVAQMFIVWLIILGSNAATVLWEATVDTLFDANSSNTAVLNVGIKPITDMSKMLACTQDYMDAVATSKSQGEIDEKGKLIANVYGPRGAYGRAGYVDTAPTKIISNSWNSNIGSYSIADSNFSDVLNGLDKVSKITFASDGRCGTLVLSNQSIDSDYATDHDESDYKDQALKKGFSAVQKSVGTALDSLTVFLSKYLGDETLPITTLDDRNTEKPKGEYLADVIIYHNISAKFNTDFVTDIKTAMVSTDDSVAWKNSMKSGGWAKAGIWFYDIGAIDQMIGTVTKSFTTDASNITVCKPSDDDSFFSFFTTDICKSMLERSTIVKSMVEAFNTDAVQYAIENGLNTAVNDADTAIGECPQSSICSPKGNPSSTISAGAAKYIINLLAVGSDMTERRGGLANPFQTVTSIGNTLNLTAMTLFAATSAANALINGSVVSSDNLAAQITGIAFGAGYLQGLFQMSLFGIMSFLGIMMSTGFTLAYALPFLPVITWILMMTGYLITVVEAVIAAPLAIILMVTPEGDGISGTRLERAMSLIAVAILKPSLMVIGMIAAITISGISFSIMNEFFFEAASRTLSGNVLDFVAIIIVYTMTALQLSKLLVSVMHSLPTQILDWFSSGTGRTFGEDSAAQGAESATGNMGQFAQTATGGAKSILGESLKNRKARQDKVDNPEGDNKRS